jgi:hypothetical protein
MVGQRVLSDAALDAPGNPFVEWPLHWTAPHAGRFRVVVRSVDLAGNVDSEVAPVAITIR